MALKHMEYLAYKQKDEESFLKLGRMYLNGIGVKTDTDKAFACFKRLAKKYNNAEAYYYVGYMLAYGVGRTVSKKKAFKNIEISSSLGNSTAKYALSMMYARNDFGTKQDLEKNKQIKEEDGLKDNCFILYDASVEIDKEVANLEVGDITRERRINQIMPKQQESLYLCQQSAEEGCPEAKLSLSLKLMFGESVEKDYAKARILLEQCLPFNVAMAYYALGYIYDLGLGVQQNCWTAFSYYTKASKLGEKSADVNIAYCYLNGYGCDRNQNLGFKMLKKLSKDGNPYANYYLGICFLNGYGCKIDREKAKDYFNMASTAKIGRAYYHLGLLNDAMKNNVSDQQNAAIENLSKAFELGDMDGAAILSSIYSKSAVGNDLEKARKLNELSVGNRSAEGYLEKAKKCMSGEIYPKNFEEADKFYCMAAMAGNREASKFLYNSYKNGKNGYELDEKKAFDWMEQNAYNGDKSCYLSLAEKYFSGWLSVEKNAEKSSYWYAKLAREGKNKKEVSVAKKMLSKFAYDERCGWNFKKDIDYMKKNGFHNFKPAKNINEQKFDYNNTINTSEYLNIDNNVTSFNEFKNDAKMQNNDNYIDKNNELQNESVVQNKNNTNNFYEENKFVSVSQKSVNGNPSSVNNNIEEYFGDSQNKINNIKSDVVKTANSQNFEDVFESGMEEFVEISASSMAGGKSEIKETMQSSKPNDKGEVLDDFISMIDNESLMNLVKGSEENFVESKSNFVEYGVPQDNNVLSDEESLESNSSDNSGYSDETRRFGKHKDDFDKKKKNGKNKNKIDEAQEIDNIKKNKYDNELQQSNNHKNKSFLKVDEENFDDCWGDLFDESDTQKANEKQDVVVNETIAIKNAEEKQIESNANNNLIDEKIPQFNSFNVESVNKEIKNESNYDYDLGDFFIEQPLNITEQTQKESAVLEEIDEKMLNKGGLWTDEGRDIEDDFKDRATNDDVNKIRSYDYNLEKDFDILSEKKNK